jgi:hypothetical protein
LVYPQLTTVYSVGKSLYYLPILSQITLARSKHGIGDFTASNSQGGYYIAIAFFLQLAGIGF